MNEANVVIKVRDALPVKGTVVAAMQYPHKDDEHLWVLLIKVDADGGFVLWSHNMQDGGFFDGEYFSSGENAAEKSYTAFANRVRRRVSVAYGLNNNLKREG